MQAPSNSLSRALALQVRQGGLMLCHHDPLYSCIRSTACTTGAVQSGCRAGGELDGHGQCRRPAGRVGAPAIQIAGTSLIWGRCRADECSVARRMSGTRIVGAGMQQIVAMNPLEAEEAAAAGDRARSVRWPCAR
jgi:hypothetical protein